MWIVRDVLPRRAIFIINEEHVMISRSLMPKLMQIIKHKLLIIDIMRTCMLALVMCLLGVLPTWASIKDGDAVVNVGYSTTVEIGDAYQRTLSRATGINYSWSSSNTSLFTISSRNKNQCTIKGVSAGKGRLNYYCSYFYDGFYRTMDFYYDITVKSSTVSVTNIILNYTEINLETGETCQLEATVYPLNATNKDVYWRTDYAAIATVSSTGLVTAHSRGLATITCYADDGSGCRKACTVIVKEKSSGVEAVNASSDVMFRKEGNSLIFGEVVNVQVYDISGRVEYSGMTQRIDNLSRGIHIVKWRGRAAKVVI